LETCSLNITPTDLIRNLVIYSSTVTKLGCVLDAQIVINKTMDRDDLNPDEARVIIQELNELILKLKDKHLKSVPGMVVSIRKATLLHLNG